MSDPVQITTHGDDAVALLIEQLKDKPRFEALLRSYIAYFQDLENTFWDIFFARRLDLAIGELLDVIGRIVGEPRNELSEDDDYRLVIRAKIRVLLSRGTGDDLIRIAKLILQDTPFTYSESYPAQVQIDVQDFPSRATIPVLLKRLLVKAKAGGVRIDVSAADPDAFRYASTEEVSPDVDHGYGDEAELPTVTGALYAGLV